MKKIILYSLIFYGLGHYLCMSRHITGIYNRLYNISPDDISSDDIIKEVEEEEVEEEEEEEVEDIPSNKTSTINVLHDLIDEIKGNNHSELYIETNYDVLTEMLRDMKDISLNDIEIKRKKQKEMKRLFLSWKKLKDIRDNSPYNKYGSYENLKLELELEDSNNDSDDSISN